MTIGFSLISYSFTFDQRSVNIGPIATSVVRIFLVCIRVRDIMKSEKLSVNKILGNLLRGLQQNEMNFLSELISHYNNEQAIFKQFTLS